MDSVQYLGSFRLVVASSSSSEDKDTVEDLSARTQFCRANSSLSMLVNGGSLSVAVVWIVVAAAGSREGPGAAGSGDGGGAG